MATTTAIDVVMPQMGVSVTEGTVTRWFKQVGELVAADETLLEISTDKVDTEVPSPASGVVTAILVQEGETVEVGVLLATIGGEGAGTAPAEPAGAPAAPAEPITAPPAAPATATAAAAADEDEDAATASGNGRTFVSPVVARIAAEHRVDISAIAGTGRGGRVTKKDILAYVEGTLSTAAATAAAASSAPAPPAAAPAALTTPAAPATAAAKTPAAPAAPAGEVVAGPGETLEPMTALRRLVAQHMRRSVDTSAHVTAVFEIDMSQVVAIRTKLKQEYEAQHGVNLTYLAFIARATVEALKDWPWINGELRGDKIVTRDYVNLGIAVALEGGKGLIVPNIKHAEEKNLLGIARGVKDLADRARTKKLLPDDVSGGTFTITNPGSWGAIVGTPIINQPQVAILDMEAMVKRAWVVQDTLGNDVIAIRPIMNLCISYDHRIIDGAYAHQFVKQIKDSLHSWDESSY